MLLMIDNYDSFTFNLVQYLQVLGAEVRVERNDALTVDQIRALSPSHIVISPGPCTPNEAGVSLEMIERLGPTTPIRSPEWMVNVTSDRTVCVPKFFETFWKEIMARRIPPVQSLPASAALPPAAAGRPAACDVRSASTRSPRSPSGAW